MLITALALTLVAVADRASEKPWLRTHHDSSGKRCAILYRLAKAQSIDVSSYANWVPVWNGFAAVDQDGYLASVSKDGHVRRRSKSGTFYAEPDYWAVSPDGKTVATIDYEKPWEGVELVDAKSGETVRSFDFKYLHGHGISPAKAEEWMSGIVWSPSGLDLTFTVPKYLDNGGLAAPIMVTVNTRTGKLTRSGDKVAPLDYIGPHSLLTFGSWSGDYNQLRITDLRGRVLHRLSGVVSAGFDGENILTMRMGKASQMKIEVWDKQLKRQLSSRAIPLTMADIDAQIKVAK